MSAAPHPHKAAKIAAATAADRPAAETNDAAPSPNLSQRGTYRLRCDGRRAPDRSHYDRHGERILVAFGGPDAAEKTTLAWAVAQHVSRSALCASLDGCTTREVRPRRGDESPERCSLESFDLDALVRDLLTLFREGTPAVQPVWFDHRIGTAVKVEQQVAENAAPLFDGVFLLCPELLAWWDLRVYLRPEEITLARVVS